MADLQSGRAEEPFGWRELLLGFTSLGALGWFVLGLVAPLTPSVGPPSRIMVVAFLIVPLAVLGMAAKVARSLEIRIAAVAGAALMVGSFLFLVQPWLWFNSFSEVMTWCFTGKA
jgi:hypothetical protein